MVGYARTGTIRSMQPSERSPAETPRPGSPTTTTSASGRGPTITVIEDLDAVPGYGAWWGEVNTNIHKGSARSA